MANGTIYRNEGGAALASRPMPALVYIGVMSLVWLPVLYFFAQWLYP
jgi:hypothetical protein